MMYVVMFCNGYEYLKDENMKIFGDYENAYGYAKHLNDEIAMANNCKVADLGDYYDVIDCEFN